MRDPELPGRLDRVERVLSRISHCQMIFFPGLDFSHVLAGIIKHLDHMHLRFHLNARYFGNLDKKNTIEQ
jgi:hypothetical protein